MLFITSFLYRVCRITFKASMVITLLTLALYNASLAQNSSIVMKDSARFEAEVISVKGNLLVLTDGTLSLNTVHAVSFADTSAIADKQELVNTLLKNNVIVFAGNKQLVYKVEEDKSISEKTMQPTKPAPSSVNDLSDDAETSELYLGVGLGLDYGGIGGRVSFFPKSKGVQPGIFIAAGYAISGIGFNAGLLASFAANKKVSPTLAAMYGYNAAIKVIGASQYDKLYYGPSVALGFKIRSSGINAGFIHIELVLPFRSSQFENDIDNLINNPAIDIRRPTPVAISIGYHFAAH